jgi:hypothetical protein
VPAPPAPAATVPAAPAPRAAAPAPAPASPPAAGSTQRPRDAAFYEEQEVRLRALARMRERGLITEEEYQRKRREIIDAL